MLRSPCLQNVGSDCASIVWTMRTQVPASVAIMGDDGTNRLFTAAVKAFGPEVTGLAETYYQYEARVSGLANGCNYSYSVQSGEGNPLTAGNPTPLRTASAGAFTFLHIADCGAGD